MPRRANAPSMSARRCVFVRDVMIIGVRSSRREAEARKTRGRGPSCLRSFCVMICTTIDHYVGVAEDDGQEPGTHTHIYLVVLGFNLGSEETGSWVATCTGCGYT